jgi:hypothetical protein
VDAKDLIIVEQSLPGDPQESEADTEDLGLPDIVLHDDDRWCLLVESKVEARLVPEQLRRHERTLRRRGFASIYRLALTKSGVTVPNGTIGATWPGLYEWLGWTAQRGEWSDRLRAYLRAAERRLAQERYLTEGTLTMFDGFRFSDENPYTYLEAKRLLKLALEELRKDATLRALGVDPKAIGRPAITGRGGRAVWDCLSLKDRPSRSPFTKYPHLTLAVHEDHLEVSLTIPHEVIQPVRQRFRELGPDRLAEVNGKILRRARRLIAKGGWVEAHAHQRHYKAQRSPAISDARVTFRLETSQSRRSGPVKPQPEWLELFASLPRRKQSNIQYQYRVHLPWAMRGLDSRSSLRMIAESWKALKPLLDVLRGER